MNHDVNNSLYCAVCTAPPLDSQFYRKNPCDNLCYFLFVSPSVLISTPSSLSTSELSTLADLLGRRRSRVDEEDEKQHSSRRRKSASRGDILKQVWRKTLCKYVEITKNASVCTTYLLEAPRAVIFFASLAKTIAKTYSSQSITFHLPKSTFSISPPQSRRFSYLI